MAVKSSKKTGEAAKHDGTSGRHAGKLPDATMKLLAHCGKPADPGPAPAITANELKILNEALNREHEIIDAYQRVLDSGLLTPKLRKLTTLFLSQHQDHRDGIAAAIAYFGGTPEETEHPSGFSDAWRLGSWKNQTGALSLLLRLERASANFYLNAAPLFLDRTLSRLAVGLAADKKLHWDVLSTALKEQEQA